MKLMPTKKDNSLKEQRGMYNKAIQNKEIRQKFTKERDGIF